MTLKLGGNTALALCAAALGAGWPLGTIPNADCPVALLAERVGMYLGQGILHYNQTPAQISRRVAASSAVLVVIVGHD